MVIGGPSKTGWHFIQRKDELKVVHSIAPRCSEKKKKKTPQINTFSFKIEMLQRDVQTLTGRCLPPVIIFCSASSTSVPTQTRCPAERACRLKGPAPASVPPDRMSPGMPTDLPCRGSVIRAEAVNSLNYGGGPRAQQEQKR